MSKENPAHLTANLIAAEGFGRVMCAGRADCCDDCCEKCAQCNKEGTAAKKKA